jgi:hypothetical protein
MPHNISALLDPADAIPACVTAASIARMEAKICALADRLDAYDQAFALLGLIEEAELRLAPQERHLRLVTGTEPLSKPGRQAS